MTSFAIEVAQLLTGRGYFEVGDFVTNVTGGVIGSILACIFIFIVDKRKMIERG